MCAILPPTATSSAVAYSLSTLPNWESGAWTPLKLALITASIVPLEFAISLADFWAFRDSSFLTAAVKLYWVSVNSSLTLSNSSIVVFWICLSSSNSFPSSSCWTLILSSFEEKFSLNSFNFWTSFSAFSTSDFKLLKRASFGYFSFNKLFSFSCNAESSERYEAWFSINLLAVSSSPAFSARILFNSAFLSRILSCKALISSCLSSIFNSLSLIFFFCSSIPFFLFSIDLALSKICFSV